MTDERADYLASGREDIDDERLDLIRHVLGQDATWSEPPPDVSDRLLMAIGSGDADARPAVPVRRWWPWVAAVASVIVLVVVAGLIGLLGTTDPPTIAVSGTSLQPLASGEAAIRDSGSGWWIRLELDGLPPATEGTYYEAWLWNDEGDGISVGTFHMRGGDAPVVLWSGVDPADYPSLWVTLEPEDGDPSASSDVMMRGRAEET